MRSVKQTFWLILYYGLAKHLPYTHARIHLWGGQIRRMCAKHLFLYCGDNVNIEKGAYFGDGHAVEIGDNSGIGINCHVPNNIKIGRNVLMGPNCFMLENHTHNYSRTDIPILKQGGRYLDGRTEIGDDVWLGRQVMILSCKKIGSHSIIGAGAVVGKDVPEYVVAIGNPIKIIRDRREQTP